MRFVEEARKKQPFRCGEARKEDSRKVGASAELMKLDGGLACHCAEEASGHGGEDR